MSRYAYQRGKGAKRRVMHLAAYDRLGNWTGALCDTKTPVNTTINMPLALPVCKRCLKIEASLIQGQPS